MNVEITPVTTRTVTITMTEEEASILVTVLNKCGGVPELNGKPMPRGLMTAWFDGNHNQRGLLGKLQEAGIRTSPDVVTEGTFKIEPADYRLRA